MIQNITAKYFSPYTPLMKNNILKKSANIVEKPFTKLAEAPYRIVENIQKTKANYIPEIFY